uniref:Reverse transcriptase zinc-binding domain-containing protein n=1 Tax=Aegilops tauschii subsp. strangulata TaxID=200361 RepID=A0A453L3Z7_AEGTS
SDRLNTRNMLKRRHYNIGDNLDCLLCGQHVEETAEHLFFRCTFSGTCWNELNISWPVNGNRLDMTMHLKTLHHS